MTTTAATTQARDNRTLAVVGFTLFLLGLFVPFLCAAFHLPDALLFASCAAEVLALIFGIMAWPFRLAKIAAIGAGLVCLWALVQFVLFSTADRSLERGMQTPMEQKQ